MLKINLDKAAFDALPAAMQAEYKLNATGGYTLDTDVPFEDVTGLKNALTQERAAHKTAKEQKAILDTQVATLNEENTTLKARALKPSELENAWKEKLDAVNKTAADRQAVLTKQIQTMLVDNVALQMATEIGTSPELLVPHIKARLSAAEEDGVWGTKVLDKEGKAAALSVKELRDEFVASPTFAPIIKGSQASGGGAAGGRVPAGGKDYGKMTEAERTALHQSNPAEFKRLRDAWKAGGGK